MDDVESRAYHPENPDHALESALEQARLLTAELFAIKPDDVTADDIRNAFQNGGFAEWPPAIAAQLSRLEGFEQL